jgi:hypothetical protein
LVSGLSFTKDVENGLRALRSLGELKNANPVLIQDSREQRPLIFRNLERQ